MAMHFVSYPWQVQDVEDGTIVKLDGHELETAATDDLFELVQESGRPNLYLDLLEVQGVSGSVASKLFNLDGRLRHAGGRLILCNLAPMLCEALQARNA